MSKPLIKFLYRMNEITVTSIIIVVLMFALASALPNIAEDGIISGIISFLLIFLVGFIPIVFIYVIILLLIKTIMADVIVDYDSDLGVVGVILWIVAPILVVFLHYDNFGWLYSIISGIALFALLFFIRLILSALPNAIGLIVYVDATPKARSDAELQRLHSRAESEYLRNYNSPFNSSSDRRTKVTQLMGEIQRKEDDAHKAKIEKMARRKEHRENLARCKKII
ncbi:MAG: hypothetical protein FWF81_06075 [Defluviitaleaceae bacterium]|nr:hypothetical protein [Defluviitaleaceae bacterium]